MLTIAPTQHFVVSLAQIELKERTFLFGKKKKNVTTLLKLVQTITPAKGPKHARKIAREAHRENPEQYHWVMKLQGEYAPGTQIYFTPKR